MDAQASQPIGTNTTSSQLPAQYSKEAPGEMTGVFATLGVAQPPAIVPEQSPGVYAAIPPAGYQHSYHQQLQQFWTAQMQEIQRVNNFKVHQLPLARIKKIMKADEEVRMIAAEAPVLFAKACEMFILELTLRSWIHTEENKRRTLQKNDISATIMRTDIFDFLLDTVPRDELKEEGLGIPRAGLVPMGGAPADPLAYGGIFHKGLPQPPGVIPVMSQPMMASPAMIVGRPAMPIDPTVYKPAGVPYAPPLQPGIMPQVWQQRTQDIQIVVPESSS